MKMAVKLRGRILLLGFSLIELLVAMAVLGLLLVMLAQIFSVVSTTWRAGRAQADHFAQARVALGMVSRDLQAAVLRPDLPAFFSQTGPVLSFFTRRPGLVTMTNTGNRPLSLVAYSVTNTTDGSNLRRLVQGFDYGDSLDYSPAAWSAPAITNTWASDMGPGTLIMRYQFIGTNGQNLLPASVHAGWEDLGGNPGINALRAVIVSLAVTDQDSMRRLIDSGKLQTLQSNLSAVASPGALRSFASAWQSQLDDPGAPLTSGGVPASVAAKVRVFECTVTLPVAQQ